MAAVTRAVRGAVQVERDDPEAIHEATAGLLREMLDRNDVADDDVVSLFFTATGDLVSAFPAEAARRLGLGRASLLCAGEIPVPGSMPRVVRVLMHFVTERTPAEIRPVYVGPTQALRDDLA